MRRPHSFTVVIGEIGNNRGSSCPISYSESHESSFHAETRFAAKPHKHTLNLMISVEARNNDSDTLPKWRETSSIYESEMLHYTFILKVWHAADSSNEHVNG